MECNSNKLFRPWDNDNDGESNCHQKQYFCSALNLTFQTQTVNLCNQLVPRLDPLPSAVYAYASHNCYASCQLIPTSETDSFVHLNQLQDCLTPPTNVNEKTLANNDYQWYAKLKKHRPKRFNCPHCHIAFSNNGQLKGHIRTHTGERPFVCDHPDCGKSFTRNEELTRHRRIHSGIRPYFCLICSKRFGRKDHLKKHQRTHEKHRMCNPNDVSVHIPPTDLAFLNTFMLLQMRHQA